MKKFGVVAFLSGTIERGLNMKIVIDIPEKSYKLLQAFKDKDLSRPEIAVKHGKPLPEGHGDLIDRKALMNRPYETGGFVEWYDEIKHAPTIIEADKSEDDTSHPFADDVMMGN